MHVLNIIPHFGGGAGKVLKAHCEALRALDISITQEIICLDYANESAKVWGEASGYKITDCVNPTSCDFHSRVSAADIVHVHFWNHPLLYYFFWAFSGQKARMVLWAYTNGVHPPAYIPHGIINFGELFTISTPYSYTAPVLSHTDAAWKKNHLRHVFMTAGTEIYDRIEPTQHAGFHIGYVGTVDYCKLYNNFISLCEKIEISDYTYEVYGGPANAILAQQVFNKGLQNRIRIHGQHHDIPSVLKNIDIFAYPLARENYGTGEQVLIEAMAAGVPQVVFAHGPEEHVVQHGITGLVADGEQAFLGALKKLHANPRLRKSLAVQSKIFAKTHYTTKTLAQNWEKIYCELLLRKKSVCTMQISQHTLPWQIELFLFALGKSHAENLYRQYFMANTATKILLREQIYALPAIFHGKTRGSLSHYASFFKSCYLLQQVASELYNG